VADLKATLSVEGAVADQAADGSLSAKVANGTHVKLKATVQPAGTDVTWSWTKDATSLTTQTSDTYEFDLDDQTKGSYTAQATPKDGGAAVATNAVTLQLDPGASPAPQPTGPTTSDSDGGKPAELEVGEYDGAFTYITLAVVAAVTAVGLYVLATSSAIELPGLNAKAPEFGTFAERLRTFVVVAVLIAGIAALAVGGWLAALEVRGRLRRTVKLPQAAAERAATIDVPKILDSASKLRGTIAVLASAVALLLGALWTVGRTPSPSDNSTTTPSTTPSSSTRTTQPPAPPSVTGTTPTTH
jgi:hypothetical protein